jgi:hypothetical protein
MLSANILKSYTVVGEAQKAINSTLVLFFNQPSSKETPIMNFLLSAWSNTGIPSVALEVGSVNIGGLLRCGGWAPTHWFQAADLGASRKKHPSPTAWALGKTIQLTTLLSLDSYAMGKMFRRQTRKDAARNTLLHKPRSSNLVGNGHTHNNQHDSHIRQCSASGQVGTDVRLTVNTTKPLKGSKKGTAYEDIVRTQ